VTASSIYFNSGESFPTATIWLNGDLSAIATGMVANPNRPSTTGDILFNNYSAVHMEGGKSLTLDAHGSVNFGVLESLGPVSITARNRDITLRNDIGPPIQFYVGGNFYKYAYYLNNNWYYTNDNSDPTYTYIPSFDPNGDGVASLYLKAVQGNIFMQGAKAAGMVDIDTGGILKATGGIFSGTPPIISDTGIISSISITADSGAWLNGVPVKVLGNDVYIPYTFTNTLANPSFGTTKLAAQAPLQPPRFVSPIGSPGPAVAPPGLPGALTALPALPPDLVNVSGIGIPEASSADFELTEIEVEPVRVAGSGDLSEIISDEYKNAGEEEIRKNILRFAGGRGVGQTTDFGRK
jgi:hypothetical protein